MRRGSAWDKRYASQSLRAHGSGSHLQRRMRVVIQSTARMSSDGRSKEPKGTEEVRSQRPLAKDSEVHGVKESSGRVRNQ